MINVFRSLLALSRFFKFHDGWDNLRCKRSIALENVQKIADALEIDVYKLFLDITKEE